jgi:tRNA G18 (ribose-2'-O)-methylase SpoU
MRGYFGIGVFQAKREVNIGTLWRHANLYGAAFIYTIGARYDRQCSDTMQTPRHIPLFTYPDEATFSTLRPYDCPLVCIELDERAVPLPEFVHPERAVYLLGAEDNGLPPSILDRAQYVVQIPCPKPYSMNVATAGTLVLYDRFIKES